MQLVINKTTEMGLQDAEMAKQNYDAYLNTIIRNKGISKSTMESYLLFEGTTEKKIELIERYKELLKQFDKGKSWEDIVSGDKNITKADYDEFIRLRVQVS